MGRPNELTGQVRPNTLSTPGGRRASLSPVPGAPGWTSTGSTSPTASVPRQTFPSAAASPRPGIARPARLWTVIVFGVIAFNVLRAIANGLGDAGTSFPTTAPFSAGHLPTPFVTIDPSVTAGVVDFGTAQDADCGVSPTAASFTAGTKVWWLAHLGTTLPGSAKVVVKVVYDRGVLEQFTGPDDTSAKPWDELCAGDPIRYFGLGEYRLEVWDSTNQVLLSAGSFELAEDPAHTTVPNPPVPPAIAFGTGMRSACALSGVKFDFELGERIYWVAPLSPPAPPPTKVLFVLSRGGVTEVDRGLVASDRGSGNWDRACSTAPFENLAPGDYQLELQVPGQSNGYADGHFHVLAAGETP